MGIRKPGLTKKAPKGTFSDNFDEKMNCFLVSMILGLAIGMEASASLGIGQKVDTDEAINELKEMDASPSLEIRQNADLKDVLNKLIKEVKVNDAKHNAEIAELKKLKAEITKNKRLKLIRIKMISQRIKMISQRIKMISQRIKMI